MSPILKSLILLTASLFAVVPPFLLGRALGPVRCKACTRRREMANRARINGEHVARLRARASSPDEVRRQADSDRRALIHLLEQTNPLVRQGVVDAEAIADAELIAFRGTRW